MSSSLVRFAPMQRGFGVVTMSAGLLAEAGKISGDFDFDGKVAFADFLTISTNMNQTGHTYNGGDLDCNGIVDFADFLVVSSNF